jgi:hypothetical protein
MCLSRTCIFGNVSLATTYLDTSHTGAEEKIPAILVSYTTSLSRVFSVTRIIDEVIGK